MDNSLFDCPVVGRCLCVWVAVLLAWPVSVQAQAIYGEVRSSDGVPLSGVNVLVPALQRGTATDAAGQYRLALPEGTHGVEYRFIGFVSDTVTVTLEADAQKRVNVTLQPQTIEVDEVTITAEEQPQAVLNRATLSVSRLDARKLNEVRGQTLGETLEELPGVTTLSTGPSIAKPVIRGLHSQRVLVLNAGVPQEGQQWGGEHAPEIDPFTPGRIEVVKGAAGVEYGVGAIGGVIRVEPRELPVTPVLGGRVSLNAFSNSMQAAGSAMIESGSKRLPGLGWRLQVSARKAGDGRTPNHVIGNSAFEEFDGTAAIGYHKPRYGVDLYFSHFGTELGLFSGAHIGNFDDLLRAIERGEPSVEYDFSYGIDAPKQTIAHDLLTVKGHYQLGSGDRLELQYGLQRNQREEYDAHRRFGDPLDEPAFSLALTTQTLDLKLRQKPRGSFFGVIGLSGMNQANVNGESGYLIPNFRAVTGGVFARETYVRGSLTLEAGTRFDYRWMEAFPRERLSAGPFVKRTHSYTNLSGVIGAIWQFAPTWSIASNFGTAWRPPGVNELYNYGVHHGTAQFEIGDPDLGSERSYDLDVTLRHVSDLVHLEVSAFNNWMQGYIYQLPEPEPTVTIRGTFPTFRYTQTDAVLRGLDGVIDVHPVDFLTLTARAALVCGDDRTNDEPLIYMPADRLTLSAAFGLPEAGVLRNGQVELDATLVRRQTRFPEGVDYVAPPPGYTLIGAGYSTEMLWGTVPINLSLSVENLFNTAYRDYLSRFRYFIDDPGRNIVLRVQVPLGSVDA